MQWMYLGLAILSEVVATTALKAAQGFTRLWPSLIVIVGYASAFYLLSLTLRTIPIGVTYAIWAGAGIALLSICGFVIYGESIDTPSAIGIGLIIGGVLVIRLFGNGAQR